MSWPWPCKLTGVPQDQIPDAMEMVPNFGTDWVTGWDGVGKCVWCKDKEIAMQVFLATGCVAKFTG